MGRGSRRDRARCAGPSHGVDGIGRRLASEGMSGMKKARLARHAAEALGMEADKVAAMGTKTARRSARGPRNRGGRRTCRAMTFGRSWFGGFAKDGTADVPPARVYSRMAKSRLGDMPRGLRTIRHAWVGGRVAA